MNADVKKILIVGPAWVGDMMVAQTLFKYLRVKHPGVILHVLAPAWTKPLLARMPEITKAIVCPFGHRQLNLLHRYRFAKTLRHEGYDQAVLLKNSWKSALIPFWAKIPRRTGWLGEFRYGLLNDIHKLDKKKLTMTVERFVALADRSYSKEKDLSLYWPSLKVVNEQVYSSLHKYGLKKDSKILALCPGAEFGPSKYWPPEYFAELAMLKIAEGWKVWLLGSPKDRLQADAIQEATEGQCVDLVGKTNLEEAVDIMSVATAAVSNDSGLMHIAAALGCPTVGIYGPTPPGFVPPLSKKAKILFLDLACSPCKQRECPLEHHRCMRDIKPIMVSSSVDKLLTL